VPDGGRSYRDHAQSLADVRSDIVIGQYIHGIGRPLLSKTVTVSGFLSGLVRNDNIGPGHRREALSVIAGNWRPRVPATAGILGLSGCPTRPGQAFQSLSEGETATDSFLLHDPAMAKWRPPRARNRERYDCRSK